MQRGRARAVLAVAALVVVGCGGGGTASDVDPSTAADVAAETTTEPPTDAPAPDDEDDAVGGSGADDDHHEMADDDHEDRSPAADHGDDVDRVVQVEMHDVRFSVDEVTVAAGERVRFEFVNAGSAPHEAVLGDIHVQDEHEAMMADGGHDDGGHHEDTPTVSLGPGESGSFVHEFSEPGELWLGCHVPGHWGAGMRTRLVVTG